MRKHLLAGASLLGLIAISSIAHANNLYFTMPINYTGGEADTVFVYGASGVTGTITSPNGFSSAFAIGASNVASVTIPSTYDLSTSGAITNNGFVVSTTNTTDNVGASYLSRQTATTDTTYLFDSTSLGTSYYAVGYQNDVAGLTSQLSLVGTQNGTQVTITPSTNFAGGGTAGVPLNITLNAGQAVLYTDSGAPGDISGTKIVSTAPIAVFGGNQCADVPNGSTACDHLLTALPSVNNYTTAAVLVKTPGLENPSSNLVRVLAATNGTVVTYQGSTVATLNAGQFTDFRTGAGGLLTASSGVLIDEYLTGQSENNLGISDPSMSYIPGTAQWLNSYVFSTPVGTQAYGNNYLDIAIATTDVASLILDGSAYNGSGCSAIAGTSYSSCNIFIAAGSGTVSDANPFLLLIDGGASYDSYLTFGGVTFSPGASPPPTPPNPPPPSPVPEPITISLFGTGLAGLAASAARRRKKKMAEAI